MSNKIQIDIKLLKIFLILSFIACWVSISTSHEDLRIFRTLKPLNTYDLLNFLRHISVYFCLFFLFTIIAFYRKKILFKNYIIFYFLIAYFVFQIVGLLLSDNSLGNISFIVSALTTILTVILVDCFFLPREKKILLIISFTILNAVFFLTVIPLFVEFLNGDNIRFYGGLEYSEIFLNKYTPRTSGLARTALIILIFIELFENNFSKKNLNKLIVFKILFLVFILLFQSRTVLFLTFVAYTFIFINKNEIKLFNFIKFLTIYLVIPFILFFLLSTFNSYQFMKQKLKVSDPSLVPSLSDHIFSKDLIILRGKSNNFSSGRYDDWNNILKNIDGKNIFYGFGTQGDRYLIDQSASNAFIYAYASSGLIGLFFFIIFLILFSLRTIKLILYNLKDDLNNVLYCVILILLALRSILETSIAVYSIDLIVFVTVFSFILDKKINIEDIKKKYFR